MANHRIEVHAIRDDVCLIIPLLVWARAYSNVNTYA